jgi:LPS-assembly protein
LALVAAWVVCFTTPLRAAAKNSGAKTGAENAAGVPPEIVAQHEGPIRVTGDKTIYDSSTDSLIVRGHATMTQAATVLTADEIELFRKEHVARAIGDVHLTDPEVEVWASRAEINVQKETATLDDARIVAKHGTYHLQGRKIYKSEGQNYTVLDGFFTTCQCDAGAPDWSVAADRLHVEMGSSGYAHDASFSILGHKIGTIPYLPFPANTDRHSGFLTGREGESGLRGFQLVQPYYLAINKSSDATVALDVETSQRVGGLGEYRLDNGTDDYLWVDGAFYDESLRSQANRLSDIVDDQIADPHIPIDRYGLIGMTRQHLTPDLTLYGDAISVSDSLYLREMNVWTLSRGFGTNFGSMRDAISHFGLLYDFEDGFARLQGLWHQDLIQNQSFALQELPQLWVSGRRELLGSLAYLDYDATAVDFWREQGVSGLRFNMNPRITVPWRWGDYVYGYGTLGGYGTLYDTSGHKIVITPVGTQGLSYNNRLSLGPLSEGGLQSRWIPYGQAGIATLLQRVYDVKIGSIEKIKHTIEPFVNYSYVPVISQNDLPLFDSVDRVNPRSLVTYGVTSRIFARLSGPSEQPADTAETINAGYGAEVAGPGTGPTGQPGQLSYINPTGALSAQSNGSTVRELLEATVMQAYDTTQNVARDEFSLSDIETLVTLFPTEIASLSTRVDYDPRTHPGVSFASLGFNFQPPWTAGQEPALYLGKALTGSFLSVWYNYVRPSNAVQFGTSRNASEFITVRTYYDLLDRLGVYVAPNYDVADSRLLSAQYGVRIKSPSDCWIFDLGITDSFNPNELAFQVQLTLGGLGSIGQTPFGRNPFEVMGLTGRPAGVLPTY